MRDEAEFGVDDISEEEYNKLKEKNTFFRHFTGIFSANNIKIIFPCIGVAALNYGNNKAL